MITTRTIHDNDKKQVLIDIIRTNQQKMFPKGINFVTNWPNTKGYFDSFLLC